MYKVFINPFTRLSAVVLFSALFLIACASETSTGNNVPTTNNDTPTARNVSITDENGGTAAVGDSLSGNYTYADAENDLEGASSFRWLRNGIAIDGATARNYTLMADDVGQGITFEVTPVAATGSTTGIAMTAASLIVNRPPTASNNVPTTNNNAPTARNVSITDENGDTAAVGDSLSGNYTYVDTENDLEGASTFRWLRNGIAIDGATTTNYTLMAADVGQVMTFEVTPVAATGSTTGVAMTTASLIVTPAPIVNNDAPTARNVTITDENGGTAAVGDNLSGNYTYVDAENDLEGASSFRWLRNGIAIDGATARNYTLMADDVGQGMTFEVTPVAATGSTTGIAMTAASLIVNPAPTVNNDAPTARNVSIIDENGGTPAVGDSLSGNYTYADTENDLEGASTFRWLRNGIAIDGATARNYTLIADDVGQGMTFEVTPVAATGSTTGVAMTTASLIVNRIPTARNVTIIDENGGTAAVGDNLSGNYTYADAENDLEGASSFRWLRNGIAIDGATASNYTLMADDVGQGMTFEVTPVAATGSTTGVAMTTASLIVNRIPTARNVTITDENGGTAAVGDNLSGNYTYADAENDLEGVSTFRWLRNGIAIDGATARNYTLIADDVGQGITFEVTPVAATGNTTGVAMTAASLSVLDTTPPMILLNGNDSLSLFQNDPYIELGANAIDNLDGNLSVKMTGSVDTNTLGSYVITYSATDAANNIAKITRTVNVIRNAFITTWKTDNPGISDDNQIKIKAPGPGYNYSVDWGDGQTDANVTDDIIHTYATAGTYTVSINGDFPQIVFGGVSSDAEKLLTIERWGDIAWRSMNSAFYGCKNLEGQASDAPDLSRVTDMSQMFQHAETFNQDIGDWNVEAVTNMTSMFRNASTFDQDIGNWNIGAVTNMSEMFYNASVFNQDIGDWNVEAVTYMAQMFYGASAFDQDIGRWNVGSVSNMSQMFYGASAFNQDIGDWNVEAVITMSSMFRNASAFNQDIGDWNVDAVNNMSQMFYNARAFDQDIGNWNVGAVSNMSWMFYNAAAFNQDIGRWNVGVVSNMSWMFYNAAAFNQDIGRWNVGAVTDMSLMFYNASAFDQDIGDWNVEAVITMAWMFRNASAFDQDIGRWNVGAVTDMSLMFAGASAFNQDIGGWNVGAVSNMSTMFAGASAFNQDIGDWNVGAVIYMPLMFYDASVFNQDIGRWNVGAVTNMSLMFYNASAFDQDIGDWDISAVNTMSQMFAGITLSPINYDALLLGWSQQELQEDNNVIFHAGNSQYSASSQNARDILTQDFGWAITDGGVLP